MSSDARPSSPRGTAEPVTLITLLDCAGTVLRRSVAPGDHFLDLGGDSLTALRLVVLLRERGFRLDLGDLFEQPDMASLAGRLGMGAADN